MHADALVLAEEAAAAVDVLDAERCFSPDLAQRAARVGLLRQLVPTEVCEVAANQHQCQPSLLAVQPPRGPQHADGCQRDQFGHDREVVT